MLQENLGDQNPGGRGTEKEKYNWKTWEFWFQTLLQKYNSWDAAHGQICGV